MDAKEAMMLLDIGDIAELTKANIKKKWRKAVLKHHPDLGGDAQKTIKYNIAYETLLIYSQKIADIENLAMQSRVETCLMELKELFNIYSNRTVIVNTIVNNEIKKIEVRKEDLKTKRIALEVPLEIVQDGVIISENHIVLHNARDEYNVNIYLKSNCNDAMDIVAKLYDKVIKVKMTFPKIKLKFDFDYNIHVFVQLERVDTNGQENTQGTSSRVQR